MADEIELKLLLPHGLAHDCVRSALDALVPAEVHEQLNYYLDTQRAELRAQRAMLRIRVARGTAVVTVKTKSRMERGLAQSQEWEQPLASEVARLWLQAPPARTSASALGLAELTSEDGPLQPPLADDAQLYVVGALANTRRVYAPTLAQLRQGRAPATDLPPDMALTLELDHSRYSAGVERFEIEMEHAQAAALTDELCAYLAALGIDAEPAAESKYAQFLRLAADQKL